MAVGALRKLYKGARIAQRQPSNQPNKNFRGGGALDDPMDPGLIVGTGAMMEDPVHAAKVARAFQNETMYPMLRMDKRRTGEAQLLSVQDQISDNLTSLYGRMMPEHRERAVQWYEGANRHAQNLADEFGTSVESASAVLASMSPQKDWFMNADLGRRVMQHMTEIEMSQGKRVTGQNEKLRELYPKKKDAKDVAAATSKPWHALSPSQKAMFLRSRSELMDDASYPMMQPEGRTSGPVLTDKDEPQRIAWGSNTEIAKAISVFEDPSMENISRAMGKEHKVRNFYNNIADPQHAMTSPLTGDTTIDTHAVGAGLHTPMSSTSGPVAHAFGSSPTKYPQSHETRAGEFKDQFFADAIGPGTSGYTGSRGTYPVHADATRQAAAQAGIPARGMQSVTWEVVRNLFPDTMKRDNNAMADIRGMWDLYQKKKIPLEKARELIVERAMQSGGSLTPDWARQAGIPLAALTGAGALTESPESEAGVRGLMNTLSGYSDEAIRWMRDEAKTEGKDREAQAYDEELARREKLTPRQKAGIGGAGALAATGGAEASGGDGGTAIPPSPPSASAPTGILEDIEGIAGTAGVLGHQVGTQVFGAAAQLGNAINPFASDEEVRQVAGSGREGIQNYSDQIAMEGMADPNTRRFLEPTLNAINTVGETVSGAVSEHYGPTSPLYRNNQWYRRLYDEQGPAAAEAVANQYGRLPERVRLGLEGAAGVLF